MIRIAIVEDEAEFSDLVLGYLNRCRTEYSVDFQTDLYQDGLDLISDYTAAYDIILLDIQMKHLDGMKTAGKIRELDEDVIIIFITSTIRFAVEGYAVDALGYVLKPVSYLSFSQILGKAVKRAVKRQAKDYMSIEVEGGYVKLELSQIYYIESQHHHMIVHSDKGDFLTAGPLKKAEAKLSTKGFSKCHNAYLINLCHVTGLYHNFVILTGNQQLPVSRARKKAFMDSLADSMGDLQA